MPPRAIRATVPNIYIGQFHPFRYVILRLRDRQCHVHLARNDLGSGHGGAGGREDDRRHPNVQRQRTLCSSLGQFTVTNLPPGRGAQRQRRGPAVRTARDGDGARLTGDLGHRSHRLSPADAARHGRPADRVTLCGNEQAPPPSYVTVAISAMYDMATSRSSGLLPVGDDVILSSMRLRATAALLEVVVATASFAQDGSRLTFEVASVRYAGSGELDGRSALRGGPGTDDPETITWKRQPLSRLLVVAFDVDFDQISGPEWLGSTFYDVAAKVPRGATKDQVRVMWQELLAERFHLVYHRIKKDFPVYELSVDRNGPKLRKAGTGPWPTDPRFAVPAAGAKMAIRNEPPRDRLLTFRNCSMADFAQLVGWPLGTLATTGGLTPGRVLDRTGIDGEYDFTVEFAGYWSPGGTDLKPLPDGQTDNAPGLFDAVREQLGLRLDERKAPLDVIVVDHADKTPTEN
jgi:uncharacterized protein (TIGR03435 family)